MLRINLELFDGTIFSFIISLPQSINIIYVNNYIIFFLLIITHFSFAQKIELYGQVLDKETKAKLAYAHIYSESQKIGINSSDEGYYHLVIDKENLNTNIYVSCLGYETLILKAKELKKKTIYLQPRIEVLDEVVIGNVETKELSIGNAKGRLKSYYIGTSKDEKLIAQFIKNPSSNNECMYLKSLTMQLLYTEGARLRIMSRDEKYGYPKKDLLTKSFLIKDDRWRKRYVTWDLSEYNIEIPKDGFFVVIEKLFLPENMTFIAPKENSTYLAYEKNFEKNSDSLSSVNPYLYKEKLDFVSYKLEVTRYRPMIGLTKRKQKHSDLGAVFILYAGDTEERKARWIGDSKWVKHKNIGRGEVIPMKVTLTN